MKTDDPFAPEADPYGPQDERDGEGVDRRTALKIVAVSPVAIALSGCAIHRLGCPVRPATSRSCQHRFCRYYRKG